MMFSKMALASGRGLTKSGLAAAVALPLITAGCSSVPDALNPAEWYRSTVDYVSGEEAAEEGQKTATETAEAENGDKYPPLPGDAERAKAEQMQESETVAEGLVADTQQGRYSSESITRQGEAVSPLQPKTAEAEKTMPEVQQVTEQPAQQMQQATAAPKLTPPRPVDTDGMSLQEIYRANLAQRLPYAETNAPSRPGGQPQPLASGGYYPTETVVISSSGVYQGGQATLTPLQMGSGAPTSKVMSSVVSKNGARDLSEFNPASVANSFKVAVIQFGNGAAGIGSQERSILRKVVALHKERGGTIRVVGHASSRTRNMDPVRHKMVNWQVSTSRADTVAKEFMRLGVDAENMYVGAVADNEPVYYEVMPSGEAGNRRAEIYIDY